MPPSLITSAFSERRVTRGEGLLRIGLLLSLMAASLWTLVQIVPHVLTQMPPDTTNPTGDESMHFPPRNLADVRRILQVMEWNASERPVQVLALYCVTYLVKQAFAIPGSAMLNVLGGAMYGQWLGFGLVSLLNSVGATACFGLSWLIGRGMVEALMPVRVAAMRQRIDQHRGDLIFYLIFTRMFPLTPNWFINIALPHVGVDARSCLVSILIGHVPFVFMTTGAGSILTEISSLDDVFNPSILIRIALVACVILALPVLKRRYKQPQQPPPHDADAQSPLSHKAK